MWLSQQKMEFCLILNDRMLIIEKQVSRKENLRKLNLPIQTEIKESFKNFTLQARWEVWIT